MQISYYYKVLSRNKTRNIVVNKMYVSGNVIDKNLKHMHTDQSNLP